MYLGENNSFFGKHHSEETRKKLHDKMLGKKPVNRRPVLADGILYESVNDCANANNISASLVLYRINSKKYNYSYKMPNDYPEMEYT
jgi:hypothetical protein